MIYCGQATRFWQLLREREFYVPELHVDFLKNKESKIQLNRLLAVGELQMFLELKK